jgi:hypothetical protein
LADHELGELRHEIAVVDVVLVTLLTQLQPETAGEARREELFAAPRQFAPARMDERRDRGGSPQGRLARPAQADSWGRPARPASLLSGVQNNVSA